MTNYLYLDEYKILHALEKEALAKKASNGGDVFKMDWESLGGFPVVNGQKIFAYSPDNVYVGGNSESGVPFNECEKFMKSAVSEFMEKVKHLWS